MFLILLLSLCAQAEPIKLKTTEVTAPALLELGFSKTIKPTEEYVYHPQYSHLSDALNNFSSLQARSIGSPTFSIRGSQSSARVLSLLEGVPLNLADGFGPEPLFIPYENLESVTVLKGSSASTFGKDAMAGAINFNLNQSQGLYTKLSYSSFNTKETYVRHGGKEMFVSAFHSHSDGNYPYKIDRLNLSGTTERNNQETLRLSFKYVNKNLRSLHLISRQIGTIPGPADFPSPSNFNNIGHLHSLFLNFSPIVSQTSMTISEKSYDGTPLKAHGIKQNTKYKAVLNNFNLEVFNELSFENFYANYLDSGSKYQNFNEAGLNAEYTMDEKTILSAATRFEFTSNTLISALGFNKTLGDWNYYLSYSQGYHPPSLTQKYSQTSYFIGNSNLKPERSDEFCLGINKDFNFSTLKFEAYLRSMTDLLENRTISPGVQQAQNTGQAQAYGFDAVFITNLSGATLKPQISYLQNKNTLINEPIILSPELQISLSAEKDLKIFNLNLEILYWQNYFDRNVSTGALVILPAWVVFNLNFTHSLTEQLTLMFSIFNLADQPREFTLGYPEPQRSFKLALSGSF